jgi:hypothetical protein
MRMDKIIRKGGDKEALRAIELVWTAQGRLPQKGAPEINAFNRQVMQPLVMDRADAKAAMALLHQEKERQRAQREIALDPSQIERSGGEGKGP